MLAKLRRRIWGMNPKHVNPAGLKRGTVKYIFRIDKVQFVKTSGSVLRLKTKVDKCGLFVKLPKSVLMSRSHFPTPKISHLSTDDFSFIYEPAEDTFLLLDALEKDCVRIEELRYRYSL